MPSVLMRTVSARSIEKALSFYSERERERETVGVSVMVRERQ